VLEVKDQGSEFRSQRPLFSIYQPINPDGFHEAIFQHPFVAESPNLPFLLLPDRIHTHMIILADIPFFAKLI